MKKTFRIDGITCNSCVTIIKRQVKKNKAVNKVSIKGNKVSVEYDEKKTDLQNIFDSIESKGYICYENKRTYGWIFASIGLLIVGVLSLVTGRAASRPQGQ